MGNPQVDDYIERSELWPDEMAELRLVALAAGLHEDFKWHKPCYDYDGDNIMIFQEMKDFLALMFFKGALLDDPAGVLVAQGPNSHSAKRIEFTSVDDVRSLADTVTALIANAIQVKDAGLQAPAVELLLVDELTERLASDPELAEAFEKLTPGRQREYNLYFSGAKKSETRESRIDKYINKIKSGKGFRDR